MGSLSSKVLKLPDTEVRKTQTNDDEDLSQISVQAALEAFAFSQRLPRRDSWSLVVSRCPGFAAPLGTSIVAMPGKVRELWCAA